MKFEATVNVAVIADDESEAEDKIIKAMAAVSEFEDTQIIDGPSEIAEEGEEENLDASLDPDEEVEETE